MKQFTKTFFTLVFATALLAACNKEQQELSITNLSATNHDNGTSEVPLGGEISIDFTATAGDDARLDYYHIELHDHPASGLLQDEYRIIDHSFTDEATFKGLRNANVHEHIAVPDTANLGAYHVVIVVVDENGNSVDTENGDTEIIVIP